MKCPKFVAAMLASGMGIDPVEAECDKEECGWWVETQDRCAIKDIALSLGYISMDATQIQEKMPHEAQFGK